MAIKTIITEPNKILRQKSKPVETVGEEEQKLMDDMLDTMYQANGIGLAAIQIGIAKGLSYEAGWNPKMGGGKMSKGLAVVIGMTIAYAASFAGMIFAYLAYKRKQKKENND